MVLSPRVRSLFLCPWPRADLLHPTGQEIKVDFDYRLDARAERGAPAPGTLLARLEADNSRPSGRDRDQRPPRDAPRGPRLSTERGVGGAGRGADRGAARGAGRGGRGGARGGREPRAPREPKTTDDLDAELEAFMAAPAPAKPAAVNFGSYGSLVAR